jgi:flagella basal body P-ring formation protein FlgA
MLALVLSGALSAIVDCSQAQIDTGLASWQIKTCDVLHREYKDVHLTTVKTIENQTNKLSSGNRIVVGGLMAGRLNVDVIEVAEKSVMLRRYSLSVYATKEVWVANRSLHKGDMVRESDFELKVVDVAPFTGLKKFPQNFSGNRRLKKALKKGGIFFEDYLEDDYVITQMQEVELVIASGNLRINTTCIALEPAAHVGDSIKVRVTETGAVVKATVKLEEHIYVEI